MGAISKSKDLVEARKRTIRHELRGYDSSLKLKGTSSFENILNKIDKDSSIKLESLHNDAIRCGRLALYSAERTKNGRAKQFLNNQTNLDRIFSGIREYWSFSKVLVELTENALNEFRSINGNKDLAKVLYDSFRRTTDDITDAYIMNIIFDGGLYKCYIDENENNKELMGVELAQGFDLDNVPEATYNYAFLVDSNKGIVSDNLKMICSNKKCVYHKTSLDKEFEDGSKEVYCSVADCEKCEAFKNSLSPNKLLEVFAATLFAKTNRELGTKREVINTPNYQPLPVAESNKDVIIYIDSIHDSNNRETKTKVYDENYIPGTHASPREHTRRGTTVTLKNGKTFERKGCIVNKGHEKTTYVIKARTDKKNINTNNKKTKKEIKQEKTIQCLNKALASVESAESEK